MKRWFNEPAMNPAATMDWAGLNVAPAALDAPALGTATANLDTAPGVSLTISALPCQNSQMEAPMSNQIISIPAKTQQELAAPAHFGVPGILPAEASTSIMPELAENYGGALIPVAVLPQRIVIDPYLLQSHVEPRKDIADRHKVLAWEATTPQAAKDICRRDRLVLECTQITPQRLYKVRLWEVITHSGTNRIWLEAVDILLYIYRRYQASHKFGELTHLGDERGYRASVAELTKGCFNGKGGVSGRTVRRILDRLQELDLLAVFLDNRTVPGVGFCANMQYLIPNTRRLFELLDPVGYAKAPKPYPFVKVDHTGVSSLEKSISRQGGKLLRDLAKFDRARARKSGKNLSGGSGQIGQTNTLYTDSKLSVTPSYTSYSQGSCKRKASPQAGEGSFFFSEPEPTSFFECVTYLTSTNKTRNIPGLLDWLLQDWTAQSMARQFGELPNAACGFPSAWLSNTHARFPDLPDFTDQRMAGVDWSALSLPIWQALEGGSASNLWATTPDEQSAYLAAWQARWRYNMVSDLGPGRPFRGYGLPDDVDGEHAMDGKGVPGVHLLDQQKVMQWIRRFFAGWMEGTLSGCVEIKRAVFEHYFPRDKFSKHVHIFDHLLAQWPLVQRLLTGLEIRSHTQFNLRFCLKLHYQLRDDRWTFKEVFALNTEVFITDGIYGKLAWKTYEMVMTRPRSLLKYLRKRFGDSRKSVKVGRLAAWKDVRCNNFAESPVTEPQNSNNAQLVCQRVALAWGPGWQRHLASFASRGCPVLASSGDIAEWTDHIIEQCRGSGYDIFRFSLMEDIDFRRQQFLDSAKQLIPGYDHELFIKYAKLMSGCSSNDRIDAPDARKFFQRGLMGLTPALHKILAARLGEQYSLRKTGNLNWVRQFLESQPLDRNSVEQFWKEDCAPPASTPSTHQLNVPESFTDPRAEAAKFELVPLIDDEISRFEAGDVLAAMSNHSSPSILDFMRPPTRDSLFPGQPAKAGDPLADFMAAALRNPLFRAKVAGLGAIQDATPTLNEIGDVATYTIAPEI